MYLVVFKATIKGLDAEHATVAARMRELALDKFGCLAFESVTEGTRELSLSYWPDLESIHNWKVHSEHVLAQDLGREKWYKSYTVDIAEVVRGYGFNGEAVNP